MKRLITCMAIVSLLVLGLAGSALAAPLDNSDLAAAFGDGNSTAPIVINGVTTTVWRPAQFTAGTAPTITNASQTALGNRAGNNITFIPPGDTTTTFNVTAVGVNGSDSPSRMSQDEAVNLNNAVSPLIGFFGGDSTQQARTDVVTNTSTGWGSLINTSNFVNLYTPAPVNMAVPYTPGDALGFALTVYPVPGDMMGNNKVGDLEVWKFIPAGTTLNGGEKDARKFNIVTSSNDLNVADGQIWFSTDKNGLSVMNGNQTLGSGTLYYMWMEVQDNGSFDMDGTQGSIIDPPTVTPTLSTSGDSSSGCVYNPAAGMSLDLLLLAVPALGVLVSRIRRK